MIDIQVGLKETLWFFKDRTIYVLDLILLLFRAQNTIRKTRVRYM